MSLNGFGRDTAVLYNLKRDGKTKLSANFSVEEFASKDGHPTLLIHPKLIELLQALRDHFGVPCKINSGYRSKKHNKAVRGSKNSTHMDGTASDIVFQGISPVEVAKKARELGAGGVRAYPTFTHVDVAQIRTW